jgi:hypothetical protein
LSEKLPLFVRESSLAPLKPEIKRRVASVIDRGAYIQGEEVAAFEQEFANYLGREHCVGVANGTDALMIGLIALGVKQWRQLEPSQCLPTSSLVPGPSRNERLSRYSPIPQQRSCRFTSSGIQPQ